MSAKKKIAVVGAGVFGCTIALRLAEAGLQVDLFERNTEPMLGASRNNQNRLHLGFHYPRDDDTAQQCRDGFARFVTEFPECIERGFPNAYFIASEGSLTSPAEYLAFCDRNGLEYRPLDGLTLEVYHTSLGILTDEVVYDCTILKDVVERRLRESSNLSTHTNQEFSSSYAYAYDVIVNATYANRNSLTAKLGYPVEEAQFEYTAVPIIRLDGTPKAGVTIMDGPFMTLLPFGRSGDFLLYHVDHTVIERVSAQFLPPGWLDSETAPFHRNDKRELFRRIVRDAANFIPAVNGAELLGFLEGPRMVLAHRNEDDARPSVIELFGSNYITVFSGKVDHCVGVAEDIRDMIFSDAPEMASP